MADRLRDSAFFMWMWNGFGRAVFLICLMKVNECLIGMEKCLLRIPCRIRLNDFYKVDQEGEISPTISSPCEKLGAMRPADTNWNSPAKKVTLQSNLTKKEIRTNQRIGAPGVGEVVRRAAKAAWLATKAIPKAEERMGIDDLPDESEKVPDWIPKVHDEVGAVPVES
jgi:hypothetical protein